MFEKSNNPRKAVGIFTAVTLGIALCYSTNLFAQILPGAICSAEDDAHTGDISHEYGYTYNRSSGDAYVICPLAREYTGETGDVNELEIVVDDRDTTDSIDCWLYSRYNGDTSVSIMKSSGTTNAFTGTATLSWTDNQLVSWPSDAMWYVRCFLPGNVDGLSTVRWIKVTQSYN